MVGRELVAAACSIGREKGAERGPPPSPKHSTLTRHPPPPLPAGEGKLFAPGNLRATFDNPAYERLISYYLGEKYTLRWAPRARG